MYSKKSPASVFTARRGFLISLFRRGEVCRGAPNAERLRHFEQRQQLEYLKKHGCDMIQGFYISMPLDEKDALELLGDGRNE